MRYFVERLAVYYFRFKGSTLTMKTTLLTKRHLCMLTASCGTSVHQASVAVLLQLSTIVVSSAVEVLTT